MVLGIQSGGVQLTLFENNSQANRFTNQATERLATGLRINRGSDDPAGLVGAAQLQGDLVEIEAQMKTNSAELRQLSIDQSDDFGAAIVLEVEQELAAARKIATASALSQLQDADYAQETSNLIKGQILTDASLRTMALYNKIKTDQVKSLFDRLG